MTAVSGVTVSSSRSEAAYLEPWWPASSTSMSGRFPYFTSRPSTIWSMSPVMRAEKFSVSHSRLRPSSLVSPLPNGPYRVSTASPNSNVTSSHTIRVGMFRSSATFRRAV